MALTTSSASSRRAGQISDGAGQLSDGAAEAKDGSGRWPPARTSSPTAWRTPPTARRSSTDGLGQAADGAPKLVDGAQRLSDEGTKKLVEAGEDTAQNYGELYATIEAGAERADAEKMAYGAPEGAMGLTAYSFVIEGENGESGRNLARGLSGLALARCRRGRVRAPPRSDLNQQHQEGRRASGAPAAFRSRWLPRPLPSSGAPELGSPVERVEPDLPGRRVEEGVVGSAEQDQVVERGVAAVGPVGQVVGVAGQRHAGGSRGTGSAASRRTRAFQIAAVTRRWVRPTSRTSPREPSTAGITSASHASRRTAVIERSSPVSRVAAPSPSRSWSRVTVTVSRGLAPCWSGQQPLGFLGLR